MKRHKKKSPNKIDWQNVQSRVQYFQTTIYLPVLYVSMASDINIIAAIKCSNMITD